VKTWKNITLNIPGEKLDDLIDDIIELEVLSVTVKDKRSPKTSDWFHYNDKQMIIHGDTHYIILLVEFDYPTEKLIHEISKKLNPNTPFEYFENLFHDTDWVKHTQSKFNEIIISPSLRIVPPWKIDENFKGNTIIIDPGSGFGTGSHPTTQLCLQWLEKNIKQSNSILDYGTGSGILSIAARALGVKHITGVDIDTRAIENANHNSELNGYDIPFLDLNYKSIEHSFDIVVANILSITLTKLSPVLKNITLKKIVLCGVLDHQTDSVIKAFSDWIQLDIKTKSRGWNLLSGEL